MNRYGTIAALALCTLSAAALAHEFRLGDLTIEHPYALATSPTAKAGAGYLTITNGGDDADQLIGVEADVPRAQLHTTQVDDAGVARMMPVEAIEIPPGKSVRLEPRSFHVMFMGISEPFSVGKAIDATLVFEKSGRIDVQFAVEPRDRAESEHDGHHAGD